MLKHSFVLLLAACDLGPRVDDVLPDGPSRTVLPAGSTVPSIATNPELVNQIRANDGLVDTVLAMTNNVILRGTGKSNGQTVRFWNFGPQAAVDGIFAVASGLYIFGTREGTTFTPLPDHPPLID